MELRKINKKGQMGGMAQSVVALGVAVIVLVIMIVIVQEMIDTPQLKTGANQCNATNVSACPDAFYQANTSLVGLGTFGDFVTIIVLALVAGVVLGIIFGVFGRTGRR